MATDDPFQAVEKQYSDGHDDPFAKLNLTSATATLGVPPAAQTAILFGYLDSLSTQTKLERGLAFIRVRPRAA